MQFCFKWHRHWNIFKVLFVKLKSWSQARFHHTNKYFKLRTDVRLKYVWETVEYILFTAFHPFIHSAQESQRLVIREVLHVLAVIKIWNRVENDNYLSELNILVCVLMQLKSQMSYPGLYLGSVVWKSDCTVPASQTPSAQLHWRLFSDLLKTV